MLSASLAGSAAPRVRLSSSKSGAGDGPVQGSHCEAVALESLRALASALGDVLRIRSVVDAGLLRASECSH